MAQQEQLLGLKLDKLQEMKDAIAVGQHPEMIPGYQPTGEIRQLIGDLFLCRVFPDLMPDYKLEVPEDPKAIIIKMTKALDEKIMQDPNREIATSGFSAFEVRGIKTHNDTLINLKRHDTLGTLEVTVSNILKETNTFPFIETEQFIVDNRGTFTMKQYVRSMPDSGCVIDEIAKYNIAQSEFNEHVAEKYDYFCRLVQPYLLSH